jgi:hypothetical protein
MFQWGPLAFARVPPLVGLAALAGGIALVVWAWRTGGSQGRYWAVAWMLTVCAFLISAAYYDQYPIFLAVPTSILLSAALAGFTRQRRWRAFSFAVVADALVLPVANSVRDEFKKTYRLEVAAVIKEHVADDKCRYADPPTLAFAADRLPGGTNEGRILVDPFGELLYTAQQSQEPFDTAQGAIESPSAQARLRRSIASCDFVVLGVALERHARFSAATRTWFMEHFQAVVNADQDRPGLWRRRMRPS